MTVQNICADETSMHLMLSVALLIIKFSSFSVFNLVGKT